MKVDEKRQNRCLKVALLTLGLPTLHVLVQSTLPALQIWRP